MITNNDFICDSEKEYILQAVRYGKNSDERKKYEIMILENISKIIEEK